MARRCSVVGCDNPYLASGLCVMHLARLKRHGNPEHEPMSPKTRFMRYIEIMPDGCWYWTGAMTGGYGRFRLGNRNIIASRASWILFKGGETEEFRRLNVCHTCDVGKCVNPDHLFLGTQKENMEDKVRKGRSRSVCGIAQSNAKLNDEIVLAIRESEEKSINLAQFYGVSKSAINAIRNGRLWKHVGGKIRKIEGHTKGDNHPMSKLDEEKVRYIRDSSKSTRELATELGISYMATYDVRNHKTWKHVV